MTLYLKYRPQKIDELDLASVRENLKNIITSGNMPHAFLFSGPKGTGKTSAARILAKVINCTNLGKDGEPCNECAACLSIAKGNNIDIIELDAASNRGIDDIRSLKEGIYMAPSSAKKKIYIIDEAHMLTLEAANAFLKTLEEPPEHVVFILATTNPEKLPQTVISRLTQVNFTKATDEDVARQLNRVAKGEQLKIAPGALKKISKFADGSFRDAVKILENISFKTKDIKEEDIDNLFSSNTKSLEEFFKLLESKNIKSCLEFIENLIKNGTSIKNFTNDITDLIHKSILAKNGLGDDALANFSQPDLINLNNLISTSLKEISPVEELPFEIAIIKFCLPRRSNAKAGEPETKESQKVKEEIKAIIKKEPVKAMDSETWQKLVQGSKEKNLTIEALLRSVTPISFDGNALCIGVYYQFHKDKLEDMKNKSVLEKICMDALGLETIRITFELIERPQIKKEEPVMANISALTPKVDKDIINAAKEIFG